MPASELVLPHRFPTPARLLARRLAIAIALLAVTTVVVYAGRSGYRDSNGTGVSLIDSLYFATVSLSTTGYGDIVPVTTPARVVNILVVTPMRILFLVVLVGTTLEVLTASARQRVRARRWRDTVQNHVVIIGYGTKGRAAALALVDGGVAKRDIAVVDIEQREVTAATTDGATAICGDGTRVGVLEQVEVSRASRVVICTNRDDTTVLATLTVRQLNTTATIVAVVRHAENAPLLRSAGVDTVVVSAEAAGRLLGVSALSPATGELVSDLLEAGSGLELVERAAADTDIGRPVTAGDDVLLGVVRGGRLHRFGDADADVVRPGDRIVAVRHIGA
jgi:voltage-gated potassium channel